MNKKEKLIDFVLCLFLGYLGVHKFYEKKTGLGILYLFTMGLFGIGWIIDIFKLFIAWINTPSIQNSNVSTSNNNNIIISEVFDTNIAGVTFDNRQELLKKCHTNQKVYIKWDKDNPYSKNGHALSVFAIINNKEEQLGHIPDKSTNFLFEKYEENFKNNENFALDGYIDKITGGTPGKPSLGCVIKINI